MKHAKQYHPVEAEALACFEVRLQSRLEFYFRALRQRITALVEQEGTLPVTFWMSERDSLVTEVAPLYEAGLRLGMELERSPRLSLDTFINLNWQLQNTIQQLARELAQDVTVKAAQRVGELLNSGEALDTLVEKMRHELRLSVLSDTMAEWIAVQQANRVIAAGVLLARREGWMIESINDEKEILASRLCI